MEARLGAALEVISCFVAGRNGFRPHRLLLANGVASYIVEPTSILVSRRARRAKTYRLDADGLLGVLMAYHRGDRQVCSVLRVPNHEEDAKRPHRERDHLVQQRVRIESLLFTQRIRERPSLRTWGRDLAALRTAAGRDLPPNLRAELDRLRRRLGLRLELIREIEAEREATLAAAPPADEACRKITALSHIRSLRDNFSTALTCEVFYRRFSNRRRLASYVGIAPMPHQRGTMDQDRRIGRAGNLRARKALIQLAWLRDQPGSAVAGLIRERVGVLTGRTRRIVAMAMARKLLVALWRYVETGVVPEGVELKA